MAIVDFDPARFLARFSASSLARLTDGSAKVGGSGGGGGGGGGGGIDGLPPNKPEHISSLLYKDQNHVEPV